MFQTYSGGQKLKILFTPQGLRLIGNYKGDEEPLMGILHKLRVATESQFQNAISTKNDDALPVGEFLIQRRIIDDAMNNPSLVLLVVDPRPGTATKDRLRLYQETGERAFLLAPEAQSGEVSLCGFDDFAQNLLPQIQWLEDFTRLRRIERTLYDPPSSSPGDSEPSS